MLKITENSPSVHLFIAQIDKNELFDLLKLIKDQKSLVRLLSLQDCWGRTSIRIAQLRWGRQGLDSFECFLDVDLDQSGSICPDEPPEIFDLYSKIDTLGLTVNEWDKGLSWKSIQEGALDKIRQDFADSIAKTFQRNAELQKIGKGFFFATEVGENRPELRESLPKDWDTGYIPGDHFEKKRFFNLQLKEGKSASEALNAALEGPSILESSTAVVLAWYKAIFDVIGPKKFDFVFSFHRWSLVIAQMVQTPLEGLGMISDFTEEAGLKMEGEEGSRPIEIGDIVYFYGVPFYLLKHLTGNACGWNVIYVGKNENGEQLFVGMDLGEPKTEKQIRQILLAGYNQDRSSRLEGVLSGTVLNQSKREKEALKCFQEAPEKMRREMEWNFKIPDIKWRDFTGYDAETPMRLNWETLFTLQNLEIVPKEKASL